MSDPGQLRDIAANEKEEKKKSRRSRRCKEKEKRSEEIGKNAYNSYKKSDGKKVSYKTIFFPFFLRPNQKYRSCQVDPGFFSFPKCHNLILYLCFYDGNEGHDENNGKVRKNRYLRRVVICLIATFNKNALGI